MATLNQFDAIVVGSGISGGWAAKELTGSGLRTLLLERGRSVEHVTDYPTAMMNPWDFTHRGPASLDMKQAYSVASRNYAFYEGSAHFFAKDADNPYIQEKPYDWIQGNQVGGRSLLWGRQTQRWSDFDFSGPARDGFAVDWPIRYADLAPWYSYVEKFAGISGNRDGLATLPDGEFLPPHQMSCVETYFTKQMRQKFPDRPVIIGRVAHLTKPNPVHTKQGRAQCQHRTLCERGCPFGGYFSSNSSTIPWAMKTGKLTLRPDSVVHSIIYDDAKKKATGVRVVDAHTGQMTEYFARVLFLNASSLNTNKILLNSTSSRFPAGLGNDNGLMGKFMAFHSYRGRVTAEYDGFPESTTWGRRPNSSYIPRFRNVHKQETSGQASRFLRGYASTLSAGRPSRADRNGFGAELKERMTSYTPGPWQVSSGMMGETIPKEVSTVRLDPTLTDRWGVPLLRVSVAYDDNDENMLHDFWEQLSDMYDQAGFKNIKTHDTGRLPGSENHEMGGVRMGRDPKSSLLNKWNQLHACKNVFVTDGACMVSTSTQNPSLTYMALTARAADYVVRQMKRRDL